MSAGKVWVVVIGSGFLLFGIMLKVGDYERGKNPPTPPIKYNRIRICDDQYKQRLDFHSQHYDHEDIKLIEGCFGGLVRLPDDWKNWYWQPLGDQNGWWVAFWYQGQAVGSPPYGANQIPENTIVPSKYFRLQGHGIIRAYSNDVVPSTDSESTPQDTRVIPPVLTYRVHPDYTKEAREAHFNGSVMIDVIINERGFVTDIKMKDPPPYGLDEEIRKVLPRWQFKPATKNGKPIAHTGTITIDFRSG